MFSYIVIPFYFVAKYSIYVILFDFIDDHARIVLHIVSYDNPMINSRV